MKFNRNYRLSVQANDSDELIVIEPPFTIEFNVNRSIQSSVNTLNISITNLGESTRNRIFQDRFNLGVYRQVVLEIGYDELSTVYRGSIFEASSTRQGSEITTTIVSRDGGFDIASTKSTNTFSRGTSVNGLLRSMINEFPNLDAGTISDTGEMFTRPVAVEGNTFEIIKKYSNDRVFVDLERVNILQDNEVMEGQVPLITSETGLIGTPVRRDAYLEAQMIMEPRITVGQVVEIRSDIVTAYNGQYKVMGVKHSGTISEAIGGQCTTTLELLIGTALFGGFSVV